MIFDKWENHTAYTVGAELEARIYDTKNFKLKNISSSVRESFSEEYKDKIHQEFLECMLEFVTPVCKNSYEIIEELQEQIEYTKSKLPKDTAISTSGSYSLEVDPLPYVKGNERYISFAKEHGILLSRFHICGFHIHVALSNSDEALQAYNFALEYLPIFLALSVNSPFFNGEDTGLLSYRAKIFEQLPRAGQPSYFDSFEEMQNLYKMMQKAKSISSAKDIWWDVRISPKFGTLEIRICDASNDFERLRLLVVLFQALCLYAQNKPISKIPHQVLLQNRWSALRHGLDGIMQTNSSIETIKVHYLKLINNLEQEEIFKKLGTSNEIKNLRKLADLELLANRQHRVFEKYNDFKKVEELGEL